MGKAARCTTTARPLTTNSVLARGADVQPTQVDPAEQWRWIPGYEGDYKVSSLGRVWTRPRKGSKGGILKPIPGRKGYLTLRPSRDGRQVMAYVHQIVALAFHGPRTADSPAIRHLDGDNLNNAAVNLAYGTYSQNAYDQVRHGTHPQASKTHCAHGHPYTPENIYVRPSRPNARHCRMCRSLPSHTAKKAA